MEGAMPRGDLRGWGIVSKVGEAGVGRGANCRSQGLGTRG